MGLPGRAGGKRLRSRLWRRIIRYTVSISVRLCGIWVEAVARLYAGGHGYAFGWKPSTTGSSGLAITVAEARNLGMGICQMFYDMG